MSFAPLSEHNKQNVLGRFVEVSRGNTFEYSVNDVGLILAPAAHGGKNIEYKHKIWVGPNAEEFRFANVGKTVAHVIVDENENGFVTEKWVIKQHREYSSTV